MARQKKLRCAILGMAHDHVWSLVKHSPETAELVAAADPDPALRDRFAKQTGCQRLFEDYEQLLEETRPDAAMIFTANAHHADLVELCAARGIHTLVEKPMAATLEQADRMLLAARRARTRLMVNWPTAWSPTVRTALRLVREGRIGQVWQLTWRGGHAGPDEIGCSPQFRSILFDKELNGAGAFADYSGYGASLCLLFLGGPPNSVMGMAGRLLKTHLPVDDNGILLLRYPHALCRLEMTWTEAVSGRPAHDTVVYGTEGTLVIGAEVWLYTRKKPEGSCVPLDDLPKGERDPFEYFVRCIHKGEDPQGQTNPDLGRAAQEIMEAGLRSATSGREIALPIEDHLFR